MPMEIQDSLRKELAILYKISSRIYLSRVKEGKGPLFISFYLNTTGTQISFSSVVDSITQSIYDLANTPNIDRIARANWLNT